MGDQTNETVHFKIQKERTKAGDVLMRVYEAMSERGYDPVNQIVGYLISLATLHTSPAIITPDTLYACWSGTSFWRSW